MTTLEKTLLLIIPIILTAAVFAYIIYRQAVKKLRGTEHSFGIPTEKDKAGDWGEEYVQGLLNDNFEHVFCNKFVNDKREGEVDAILFYNGHLLCIEIKDLHGMIHIEKGKWYKEKITSSGRLYTDSIKNLNNKNKGNCINLKEHLLEKKTGYIWVDSLLCFSDKCQIHELEETDMNVCHFGNAAKYIRDICAKHGPVHEDVVKHLWNLPEWDVVEARGIRHSCYITSRWIGLINANDDVVKLYTKDIFSISIWRSFIALKPDKVEVMFMNGRAEQFKNYKGKLHIKGEAHPVSLSRVNSVTFGRMN